MRDNADGFTLVEVLAALAVFSLAAIGLIQVTAQTVHSSDALQARFAAQLVAENVLVDTLTEATTLREGETTGAQMQMSRELVWSRQIARAQLENGGVVEIRVRVFHPETEQQLAEVATLRRRDW